MTDPDPTQTPPPDAALPVEFALVDLLRIIHAFSDPDRKQRIRDIYRSINDHIAALTAQNADLHTTNKGLAFNMESLLKHNRELLTENAALVAERDALRGEVVDLRWHMTTSCGHPADKNVQRLCLVCSAASGEERKIRARIEALEWVYENTGTMDSLDIRTLNKEIDRLKAQGENPAPVNGEDHED
jgi:hypothetical protein